MSESGLIRFLPVAVGAIDKVQRVADDDFELVLSPLRAMIVSRSIAPLIGQAPHASRSLLFCKTTRLLQLFQELVQKQSEVSLPLLNTFHRIS